MRLLRDPVDAVFERPRASGGRFTLREPDARLIGQQRAVANEVVVDRVSQPSTITVSSSSPSRSASVNQPMSCIWASVVSNGAIRLWVRSGLIAGSISRFLNAIGSQWLSVDPGAIGVLA